MPFECDQPGCTYHGITRAALAAHKRSKHQGVETSAGKTRYTLKQAKQRQNNARSFGKALSGKSRLWTLPKNVLSVVASSLTGKKGSFKQQMQAAKNNISKLTRNLVGRGGGRGTRRKRSKTRGTRRR